MGPRKKPSGQNRGNTEKKKKQKKAAAGGGGESKKGEGGEGKKPWSFGRKMKSQSKIDCG